LVIRSKVAQTPASVCSCEFLGVDVVEKAEAQFKVGTSKLSRQRWIRRGAGDTPPRCPVKPDIAAWIFEYHPAYTAHWVNFETNPNTSLLVLGWSSGFGDDLQPGSAGGLNDLLHIGAEINSSCITEDVDTTVGRRRAPRFLGPIPCGFLARGDGREEGKKEHNQQRPGKYGVACLNLFCRTSDRTGHGKRRRSARVHDVVPRTAWANRREHLCLRIRVNNSPVYALNAKTIPYFNACNETRWNPGADGTKSRLELTETVRSSG